MGDYLEMLGRMRRHFDAQEELRERVLELSRRVIRASARSIVAMHRGDPAAKKMLKEARAGLAVLMKAIESDPAWVESGAVQSAQQEYCEAKLMEGFFKRGRLPDPWEVEIPYKPYLAALADVSGELRRRSLDLMRVGKAVEVERVIETMEKIHELLIEFDYPDAILPGMKRRQDMVRGILEKTRGDLAVALGQQRLEKALERARRAR